MKLTLFRLSNPCQALFQLCLMKAFATIFIGEEVGLVLSLEFWEFWIPSHVGQVESSAEERVKEVREDIFSFSLSLPRCLLGIKWETNPTMHYSFFSFSFFLYILQIFFSWINTKRQIHRCTKDFWNLLSGLTHRSSVKDKLRVYIWIIW